MLVLFLLFLGALNITKTIEQQYKKRVFYSNVSMGHTFVTSEIDLHRTLLKSTRAYFQNSYYVTPTEFTGYLKDFTNSGFNDVYFVSWIEYVSDQDRDVFETRYANPIIDFDIVNKRLITAPQRPYYYVSKYLHAPNITDKKVIDTLGIVKGIDICFAKRHQKLCLYMQNTRQPVVIPTLSKEVVTSVNDLFLVLLPVFSETNHMIGVVAHAYKFKNFFNVLLSSETRHWLELEISDITDSGAHRLLFTTQPKPSGLEIVKSEQLFEKKWVTIGDRQWQFTYRPSAYLQEHYTPMVFYWVIIGAFFILSVIGAFLLSISGREQCIRQEVDDKTREISEKALLLEKSEAKYRQLVEGVQDDYLIYSRNVDGQLTYISPSVETVLGYKPEEFISNFSSYLPNNELNLLAREYTIKSIQGETVPPYELEIIDKKGDLHTFRITKSATIDQQGKIIGIEGIAQDITQLKVSHMQLEKLSLAVTHSSNAVLISDINGTIEYVNPKFSAITGLALQDIKVKWPEVVSSPMTFAETYQEIWKSLRAGQEWRGDLQNRKMNGDLYWAREHISPMLDADGSISHFVVMQEDITESRRLLKEIEYQASHDMLTGLINRREFETRLTRLIHSVRKDKAEHALCFLDLDQFKVVNDTCGHVAGDELLRQVSSVMQGNIHAGETLARLGGDEFVILMQHCGIEQARNSANKIIQALDNFRFQWDGGAFKIGVSIGLILIDENSPDRHKVLRQVDSACYAAKDAGRNRVEVYSENSESLQQRKGEIKWSSEVSMALDNDRFLLFVQAIESTRNAGEIYTYEVLVRMQLLDGSIIPPNEFLPAAERYNSATRIDRWVVSATLSWFSRHVNKLQHIRSIAINLSGQSLGDEYMLRYIVRQIEKSKFPTHKIKFEITETAAIANLHQATLFIATLSKFGCRFVLDDFGSGLSSFAYLKNLQFDELKIDGMFVKDILQDPLDFEMVKSINQIGHVMGLKTIAEYVENQKTLDKLKEIGVDYVQGYHIGKPEPIASLLDIKT